MPTVSVIMPMYNSVKFVKQAIESILGQTYKDLEIIAINDGSKDGCADVVREIKDERLIFIDRENHGFVNTLNECIEMAKGEFIARLDDDDWCYPTRIEKQVAYLKSHPDTVLVGTLRKEQTGDEIVDIPDTVVQTPAQIRYGLVFGNFAFAHSSFMMRRDIMIDHHVRYEMFKQVPDYHMITQMSRYGEIARIPEHLTVYRLHPSQSTQVRSLQMKQGESDRARAWFIDTLSLSDAQKTALKKGVLRKLKTKEDVLAFDAALDAYREQCGLDKKSDRQSMLFLYKFCMHTQFCTPSLLFAFLGGNTKGWLFSKEGLAFAAKCLLKKNPAYLETEVDIEQ
ncbi:MAG: glycosyltransferase family 2 protein [Lachnospiraceae bacterium]|nr:glycosyltransferase family 2 protein [Lachnospiraceae bacterium]